jgi:putative transposase
MAPEPGHHRLRRGRRSIPNHAYLVTATAYNRKPVFAHPGAAVSVLQSFSWLEARGSVALEACVVMPDHVHAVMRLENAPLRHVMRSFKGYTGSRISQLLGSSGPVWQPAYHDHALRREESLRDAVVYCLSNPVRAGLVDDFHAYPYWYCRYDV